jgi:hypothetical protein
MLWVKVFALRWVIIIITEMSLNMELPLKG